MLAHHDVDLVRPAGGVRNERDDVLAAVDDSLAGAVLAASSSQRRTAEARVGRQLERRAPGGRNG